jgi:formylglycine-generating enzyme required for sulfatase activity
MSDFRDKQEWAVTVVIDGRRQEFADTSLPLSIGGDAGTDVRLAGVPGTIQVGRLGAVFFVQATRSARNLRVDGEVVRGSQPLRDGSVVAFDRARLSCSVARDRLTIAVDLVATAGDTAPPDLEEVTRQTRGAEVAIQPIAFKPASEATASRAGRKRPSPAAIAVSSALAVLAVLGWFAFTAKSVALNIEPKPEQVSLPSTLFKVRVGDRFLLRRGSHRVEAELAGYYPLDARIEVGAAADQSVDLTFTKLPGLVTLRTDPDVRAQLLLDGAPFGATPLTDAEITPGLHRLEFTAERYLSQVLELEVTGGGERQSLVATLTPNWAPVSLATEPSGATVLVNGVAAGTTPAALELTAGEHELEVRSSGYNAWTGRVAVIANQPQQLPPVRLTRADGRVEIVTSPSEATVSVNDEFRGRTPLTLRLTPERTHRITVAKAGYDTATREMSVAADSGRRVQIDLVAQYGEIDVRSEPASAEIWVDGQRQGITPSRVTLTALPHVLEVRSPGFAPERAELTPRPGFPQVREFKLVALDRDTGSGYATVLRTSLSQELKIIPSGQFTMGTSRSQRRRANEVVRPVRLTKAFYLGVREVTNAEFRAFVPAHDSGQFNNQSLNDDAQPVVRVTWDQVAQFMNALSIRDGLQPVYEDKGGIWVPVRPLRNGYRLPTEAEWEWAARFAGREAGLLYPWGNELPPPDRSGNYADVSAAEILPNTLVTYDDGFPVSAPSGSFAANELGIQDLGGNVAEWVQDYYELDALENPALVQDPLGPEEGRFHLVRGASWRSLAVDELRLAVRNYEAEYREDVGFRLARNLE